jgi:hypothetical protein
MTKVRCACTVFSAVALFGCSAESAPTTHPSGETAQLLAPVRQASGGYHFLIPADFNGGIFGGAIDNRVTFTARRDAEGNVSGRWTYEQTDPAGTAYPNPRFGPHPVEGNIQVR